MNQRSAAGSFAPGPSAVSSLADASYVESLRKQMVKFATLQIGDSHLAEDAVQEALIGALKNARSFGAKAALRTWVFAILKNKIADVLRRRHKSLELGGLNTTDDRDPHLNALFDGSGSWHTDERPLRWDNPEGAFTQDEFWTVFEACLEHLPARQARVFMMREFIELDSTEICESLDLSVSNLHVILHRARLRLRECLEDNWYAKGR